MTLLPWKRTDRESGLERSSFEELALPLFPSLYNVAHWLARNPSDAEDLVQETFLKALKGFSSFEPGSNFKAWIFRILRNTYLTSRTGLAAMRTTFVEDEFDEHGEPGSRPEPEAMIDRVTPEINLLRLSDQAALQKCNGGPAAHAAGSGTALRCGRDEIQGDCRSSRRFNMGCCDWSDSRRRTCSCGAPLDRRRLGE